MAKQLNVNLAFTADTSQAKKQLADLQESLKKVMLMTGDSSSLFDDIPIKKASEAALELQQHLKTAVDTKTGNLDLSRFSTSLKVAGKDLNTLYSDLINGGKEGQQAFLNLAKSISLAETPTTRISEKMQEFSTTLKNTLRWQVSSNILHGLESTLENAYSYAQDLNKSLNDIRIVTGQSADQMAEFAKKANESAKTLSASTLAYTDAALIFYQEGLNDTEVKKRTDTTIKMSNVTGDSVNDVSSYMTAIWENYADGAKNLEYYADVITRLGADTAASSAEIAEGLESFASIGETIGLSYEYATSALTTLVAKTRASASEVGNGLRTIFSRLQSLSLGETLEDGTDLTKYSKALATVGVDVKDASGELRRVDDILKDIGERWDSLSRAQQTALANTVGGVRQYTKFISLFDNWDFMEENLASAINSEGSLQEQADIYAESWEAARKRVTASAQGIYNNLIDDNFFITVSKGFAIFLDSIDSIIEHLGGLKGVLSMVGSIFLSMYSKKIPSVLENLKQNFLVITGQANKAMLNVQEKTNKALLDLTTKSGVSDKYKIQAEGISKVNQMQQKLILSSKNLTEAEKERYKTQIQNIQIMYQELAAMKEKEKALKEETKKETKKASRKGTKNIIDSTEEYLSAVRKDRKNVKEKEKTYKTQKTRQNTAQKEYDQAKEEYNQIRKDPKASQEDKENARKKKEEKNKILDNKKEITKKWKEEYNGAQQKLTLSEEDAKDLREKAQEALSEYFDEETIEKILNSSVGLTNEQIKQIKEKLEEKIQNYTQEKIKNKKLDNFSNEMKGQAKTWKDYAEEIDSSFNKKEIGKKKSDIKTTYNEYTDYGKSLGVNLKRSNKLEGLLNDPESSIKDVAEAFETWVNTITKTSGALGKKIKESNSKIEDIEENLEENLGDSADDIENAAEEEAQHAVELDDQKRNVSRQGEEDPEEGTFKVSTAVSEFGGAAMATYSLMESFKNLGASILEGGSALEIFGGIVSVAISGLSALNAVTQLSKTLVEKETLAKIAETVAEKLNIETKQKAAVMSGLVGAAILALIAIIWLVVKAFKAAAAASPEGQLKALQEQASALSETLSDAKQAAEDLTAAFDEYDSAVETLEACTKGTQEWRDALVDTNNTVLDLLHTYPQLAQYITRSSDGQLIISEKGEEVLKNAANQAIISTQGAYNATNQDIRDKKIEIQENSLNNKFDNFLVQGVLSKNIENLSGKTEEEMREILQSALPDTWDDNIIQDWIDKILEEKDSIDELNAAIQENTLATKTENQAIADEILSDNNKIQNSKYSDEILAASANIYDQLEEKESKKLDEEGWGTKGISKATGVNEQARKIFEEYAEAAGITGATLVDTTGDDDNRQFVYEDSSGTEKTVDLEVMKAAKAAYEASGKLAASAEQMTEVFKKLDSDSSGVGNVLKSILVNGNFEDATENEVEKYEKRLGKGGNTAANVLTLLGSQFGGEDGILSDEEAQALGKESASAFVQETQNALDNYKTASEDLGSNWYKTVQNQTNSIVGKEDLKFSAKETLGETLNTAFENSGNSALIENLGSSLKDLDSSQLEKVADVFEETDWSSISTSELINNLKEAGVEMDSFSTNDLGLLITSLQDTSNSISAITEQYSKDKSIADGLSDSKDSISSDDYDKLSDSYKQYFREMLDGTYELMISAKEFKNIVKSGATGQATELLKESNSKKDTIQNLIDSGTNLTETAGIKWVPGEGYVGDDEILQQKIDVLRALQDEAGVTEGQLTEWQEALNNQDYSKLKDLSSYINELDLSEEALQNDLEKINAEIYNNMVMVGSASENFNQLNGYLAKGVITTEALGASIDTVTQTMAEAYDLDFDDIVDQGEALSEMYELSSTNARELAVQNQRMNKGVSTLVDNWSDWQTALNSTDKLSMDYIDTVQDLTSCIANLVGASEDLKLPSSFFESQENLDLIAQAAQGSEDAINRLGLSVASASVEMLELSQTSGIIDGESWSISEEEFETAKSTVLSGIQEMQNSLDTLSVGDNVFDTLGGDKWVEALNELALATSMSVDDMNSLLNSMGVEAEVAVKNKEVDTYVPVYKTYTRNVGIEKDEEGKPWNVTESKTVQTDTVRMTGTVGVAQINTGDNVGTFPKDTITYTGNARVSNSAKKGSSSSSGGSSGGSSKPSKKDHEKHDDSKAELYHEINEAIKEVEHEMNKLDKTQEHLAGKELINSLKQENKLLKQQRANYAELNKEIQKRQNVLKNLLSQYGNAEDYYTTYNNIQKTYNNAVDAYNKLIDSYNKMSKDEQEDSEDTLEKEKEKLDELKETLDKAYNYLDEYYDNKEELRSNDEKQQELLYQQIENNLEAYEVEIELKLDTTEAERSLAEFLKNMQVDIKNSYKTSSEWGAELGLNESNSALAENDINTHLTELAKYQEMLKNKDWGKESSLFASESELLQAINETQSSLIEDAGNLLDAYEDAYSDLQDMFDEAIEQFEDAVTGVLDRIDDTIDHYQKVNELLYGDSMTGLENNDAVYKSQMKSQLARQSALKELIASLNEEMAEALAKGIDPDDSYITSIKEQINEADSELQSSVESYLETLQSVFENTLSMIRKETDEAIFGDSFSDVQQEWDDRKAMAEGYYDEVEKIYQLESLENKWRSAINSTSSLKVQKQLKTIMDKQVKTLEEKTALSEKDVALAEKEIALYQAQIALEEAQNSKNAMKLIRDESGNWSYQYIADEDEVEEKQQDYLDKLNEYRTATIDATEEVQEKYLNAYNDLMDRWNEIQENAKNGSISEEERLEAIAELQETYLGKNGILTKIFEEANYFKIKGNEATFLELWGLYEEDEKNYEKMTDAEKDAIDGLKEYGITSSDQLQKIFSEGSYEDILKLADAVNKDASVAWSSTLSEALNSSNLEKIIEIFNNLKTKGTEMIQEYQEGIKEGEDASGDSFTKIGEHLTETNSQIEQVKETANGFFDQFSEGLSAAIDQVISLKDKWDALSESIKNSVKDIGDIASKLAGSNISTTVGILGNVGAVNISSSTKSKSGENSNGKSSITTISNNGIKSFDTGGYTGDWGGGQGRLAVLHAKELVLNSKDTSNLLSAVSAMRSLTNFEDISNSITASVASLVKKMLGFETNSLKGFFNRSKDTEAVNNVFNINAEFPNANNADEIREAILSLPNLASQYLSRNRL